jgi:hypothetical protein
MRYLFDSFYYVWISIFSLFLSVFYLNAEVLIMTHMYNKPKLIYWQEAVLRKFIKDDYKFIIFNDAPTEQLSLEVKAICQSLNLTCIDVPQVIHDYKNPYLPGNRNPLGDPSAECADTIQYMLDTIGFDHPGKVMVLDSDMFLIREVHIEEIMKGYDILGHNQTRQGLQEKVTYLLPNLMIFDMARLSDKKTLNFNLGIIDGVRVDTGGYTYLYLRDHPEVKWLKVNCVYSLHANSELDLDTIHYFKSHSQLFNLMIENKYDYEFYANYTFLHFRAGSNWYNMDQEKRKEKLRLFYGALADILGQSFSLPE